MAEIEGVETADDPAKEWGTLKGIEKLEALSDSLKMRIVRWYFQQKSYREMADLLKEQGVKTDHYTVYRWCIRHLHSMDSGRRRIHEDKLEELQEIAILRIIEKALESLEKCDLPEIKTFKEFESISQAVARAVTARSQVERVKIETTRAVQVLEEQYRAAIRRELSDRPELVQQIHEAIAQASKNFASITQ